MSEPCIQDLVRPTPTVTKAFAPSADETGTLALKFMISLWRDCLNDAHLPPLMVVTLVPQAGETAGPSSPCIESTVLTD